MARGASRSNQIDVLYPKSTHLIRNPINPTDQSPAPFKVLKEILILENDYIIILLLIRQIEFYVFNRIAFCTKPSCGF